MRERRHVRGIVGVGEHACVVGGEPVPACVGCGADVVGFEQSRDGLLLEPLARVARRDARAVRKVARGQRSVLGKGAVEAELGTQVDGEQLEGADRGAE